MVYIGKGGLELLEYFGLISMIKFISTLIYVLFYELRVTIIFWQWIDPNMLIYSSLRFLPLDYFSSFSRLLFFQEDLQVAFTGHDKPSINWLSCSVYYFLIIKLSFCSFFSFPTLSSYLFITIGTHKISLIILNDTCISISTFFRKLFLKKKKEKLRTQFKFALNTLDSEKQALIGKLGI